MKLLKSIRQPANPFRVDSCLPQKKAVKAGKIRLYGISHGHYPGSKIPPKLLPGLCNLGFWDAVGFQNWGLEPHRNEGIEIVFLETGQLPFSIGPSSGNLEAGSFTVTRPWQLHCHGDPLIGPGRLHWAIIDVGVRHPQDPWKWPSWVMLTRKDLAELTQKLRYNETPCWQGNPTILQAFKLLSEQIRQHDLNRRGSHLIIGLNQLLLGVLESLRSHNIGEDPRLASRRRTVELFLKDMAMDTVRLAAKWTLESMAVECGMGVTAFVKYCHSVTNTSPVDYLNRCRLEHAATLLSRNKAGQPSSITDIAFQCGYSSSQYFATQFRQQYGCTPQEYRNIQGAGSGIAAARKN